MLPPVGAIACPNWRSRRRNRDCRGEWRREGDSCGEWRRDWDTCGEWREWLRDGSHRFVLATAVHATMSSNSMSIISVSKRKYIKSYSQVHIMVIVQLSNYLEITYTAAPLWQESKSSFIGRTKNLSNLGSWIQITMAALQW